MIGTRLGKWVLDREIGRGGMGRVYVAHEEPGGSLVAIKVLIAELAQEPGFLPRFRREIEVLSQLDHPNIVHFHESGAQDGHFFYAMEYVEGDNFEQLLLRHYRLPWREVLDAAMQVCPALKHAHDRGIVHRDIKPPNLLRSEGGIVKLTDFGIAKVFAGRQLTSTGGVVGTAEYLSPEQATGKTATKRSDLYSLGVVLYALLTGRPPFEGQTAAELLHKHLYGQFDRPKKLVPDVPYELDEIVCRLMEKEPGRRPADAMVLHKQLDSFQRKLARKAELTMHDVAERATVAENKLGEGASNPGPATLMSRLVRSELERENRGSLLRQWFNRPVVLFLLFAMCVSILVWKFVIVGQPTADQLFYEGSALMESSQPADWDRAWSENFEKLNSRFPNHPYRREVEEFRRRIDDQAGLRRALAGLRGKVIASDAERFYLRGLRLCQEGDAVEAARIWKDLIRVFEGIPEESRWVKLANAALAELNAKVPVDSKRQERLPALLQRVSDLRKQGKAAEADTLQQALRSLYGDELPKK